MTHHFVLVAERQGRPVGMIEVRDNQHIALLFVAESLQHQGIGRELVGRAVAHCCCQKPRLAQVTVNSSPNAVGAYEKMGFRAVEPAQVRNGIEYVPMVLELPANSGG